MSARTRELPAHESPRAGDSRRRSLPNLCAQRQPAHRYAPPTVASLTIMKRRRKAAAQGALSGAKTPYPQALSRRLVQLARLSIDAIPVSGENSACVVVLNSAKTSGAGIGHPLQHCERSKTMHKQDDISLPAPKRVSWNKGKLTGAMPPLRPQTCLGHTDKATSHGPQTRFGTVQSCNRYQAARL